MSTLDTLFEQAAADYAAHEEAIVSFRRFAPYITAQIVVESGPFAQVYDAVRLGYKPEIVHRIPGSTFSFGSYQYTPATFWGAAPIDKFQTRLSGAALVVTVASLFIPTGLRPVTTDTVSLEVDFNGWYARPHKEPLGSFTPEFRDPRLGLGDCAGPCSFDSSSYPGPPAHFCIQSLTPSQEVPAYDLATA
jgi:hypothetical protein